MFIYRFIHDHIDTQVDDRLGSLSGAVAHVKAHELSLDRFQACEPCLWEMGANDTVLMSSEACGKQHMACLEHRQARF